MLLPIHIAVAPDVTVVDGMVIVLVAVLVHPAAFFPVTVYVLVMVVLQVTGFPVDELRLVVGDHV